MMKVTIENKSFGHAIGKNLKNEIVFIKNGDLINRSEVNGILIQNNSKYILVEIPETYKNEELLKIISDSDQLISTKKINEIVSSRIFKINDKWVFPHHHIHGIINYLLKFPNLWCNSRLALTGTRGVYAAAKRFGISFEKAIEKLNKKGFSKARLFCENLQDFSQQGVVAEMLANTYADKKGVITLEIWQGVKDVNEVFYAHGIMNTEKTKFTHFDCAIINYSIIDKENLFTESRKLKGENYKKLFRIDGEINNSDIFELANSFFPLDRLIDEYFEIERLDFN